MKIDEKKSVLYSKDITEFRLVFSDIDSAGEFIGVCCHVNGQKDAPAFFEVSKDCKNVVPLNLSGMLSKEGAYDLTIIPIYVNGDRHESKDIIEPNPHIYLGEFSLALKKRNSSKAEFYCKEDPKIKMDNLRFEWGYDDRSTPEYELYYHKNGIGLKEAEEYGCRIKVDQNSCFSFSSDRVKLL